MSENETTEAGYAVDSPWTWRERWRECLYPTRHADVSVPRDFTPTDCVTVRTAVYLSWADRMRVLWSGRLIVETKTSTEREVGQSETTSAAWPVLSWHR